MQIKEIQFIGKSPIIGGIIVSQRISVSERGPIRAMVLDGDIVKLDLESGYRMLVPVSSVYITCDVKDELVKVPMDPKLIPVALKGK